MTRFRGGKSFALEAPDEHVDVLGQFIVDLVVNRWPPEEPCAGAEQVSHIPDQAGLRTRAIALTIESHWADCARSSARPVGVSE